MDKALKVPIASVIMPAFNASAYIRIAIDSVISQTFEDWELIIVDDGSSDDTAIVVNEYILRDTRVKYFYQDNGKQGKARNLAISKSNGYYLAFLDADDSWLPEKLAVQINEIKEKNVDLVFSNSYYVYDLGGICEKQILYCHQGILDFQEGLDRMIERNRVPILTVLVKKSSVLEVGMFTENSELQYGEDTHLWLKLLINKAVFYGSNEVLAIYRIHSKSVTRNEKFALRAYSSILADVSFNNKELIFRIIFLFVHNHIQLKKQLEAENESLKRNIFIQLQKKFRSYFKMVRDCVNFF